MAGGMVAFDSDKPAGDEQDKRRAEWQGVQDAVQPVLLRLETLAKEQVDLRKPVERRWLDDLRQYWGQYDENTANVLRNDDSRSGLFINITRTKTNAWSARLGDMLFPNDEKNWGIDPTPVPTLTREQREIAEAAAKLEEQADQAAEEHNQQVDAGQVAHGMVTDAYRTAQDAAAKAAEIRALEASVQQQIEFARKRCSNMERLIDDQLTESKFPAICRDAIDDLCRMGIGVVKGPVVAGTQSSRWAVDDAGNAALQPYDDPNPMYRRVSPWHFFPDMSAACMDEAAFTLERHLPNRKTLRRMGKEMGWYPETVRKLLGPNRGLSTGSAVTDADLAFITELRSIENQDSVLDGSLSPLRDRYVVWEYRGTLECDDIAKMMRAEGRTEDADRYEKDADPLDERMVTVWFSEGMLLKIEEDYLLDSGASLYSVANFEKSEASILGSIGVPRIMRDEQAMLNAAVRMVMDNAALASAPQIVIDRKAIQPVDGDWKIRSRKQWNRVDTAAANGAKEYKPFETFDIPLNQAQLSAVIELALRFIDETTALPMIAQGEQGAQVTKTFQGMSMLFNNANVVFRRVVKNYDDDMIGLISRTFDFNMQFSKRPEIKGDAKIEARGTSVLLVREVQSQVLLQILNDWSVHPIMGVAFRAYNAMRMVLQAMSITPDDLLVPFEEYTERLKKMAEGGPDSPEAVRAQAAIKVAEIDAESRQSVAQTNMQIAQLRRETEFAALASTENMSLAQVQAMFAGKKMDAAVKVGTEKIKTQSAERKLAVEVAVDREAAREARAHGEDPTGSGGSVSMGGAG